MSTKNAYVGLLLAAGLLALALILTGCGDNAHPGVPTGPEVADYQEAPLLPQGPRAEWLCACPSGGEFRVCSTAMAVQSQISAQAGPCDEGWTCTVSGDCPLGCGG